MGMTKLEEFNAKRAHQGLKREIVALIATWTATAALLFTVLFVTPIHDTIGRLLQFGALGIILWLLWQAYFKGKRDPNKEFEQTISWFIFAAFIGIILWLSHAFPSVDSQWHAIIQGMPN